MELTEKQRREMREFKTLFENPKHARQMWAQSVYDRYSKPAMQPIPILADDKGTLTRESQIEIAIYKQLTEELREQGISRPVMDGEFMEACQSYYARHNSASYVARRDSMGAKPVEESKQTHNINNPYESLSDDELVLINETLQAHRQRQLASPRAHGAEEIPCIGGPNDKI